MRDVDFKTMLVTAFALWPIVLFDFIWYPLKNYFSFGWWSISWLWDGFRDFFQVKNEENSGDGVENDGDGQMNAKIGETQPQSAKKMRHNRQCLMRGHEIKLYWNDDEKNVRTNSVNIQLESINFSL